MAGVLEHVNIVIEQILNHGEIPIEEIVLLSEEERKTLLRRIGEKKGSPLTGNKEMGPEDNADFDF
jgi:antitoxin component of RelBE/YafQ-DinJ toxin-antitoxin module